MAEGGGGGIKDKKEKGDRIGSAAPVIARRSTVLPLERITPLKKKKKEKF